MIYIYIYIYIHTYARIYTYLGTKNGQTFHLLFKENVDLKNMVKGILHAHIGREIAQNKYKNSSSKEMDDILNESQDLLDEVSHEFIQKLLMNCNSNQQREEIRDNNCSTAAVSTIESRVHEYWLVEELMLETKYARLNLHEVAE